MLSFLYTAPTWHACINIHLLRFLLSACCLLTTSCCRPPGEPAPDFQTSWPVGILALEEDARTNFFSKVHIHTGVGMANCIMVEPMNQVVNHCKCRDAKVCGEEEKLVLQLLKDGKMPHRYELPVFTGTQQ
uniref:Uncharacterized protein n=1 Tax=Chlamydomonas chlamydogama TaxID=225041 RepID=A0A7S2QUD9_9CHLO|mmetsp:Transcript_669/g.1526  ORF Transcript_669/g.1526 Transcript_669/m.1526 type:complete len:131 (+) Transcript_669:100-492(+)